MLGQPRIQATWTSRHGNARTIARPALLGLSSLPVTSTMVQVSRPISHVRLGAGRKCDRTVNRDLRSLNRLGERIVRNRDCPWQPDAGSAD